MVIPKHRSSVECRVQSVEYYLGIFPWYLQSLLHFSTANQTDLTVFGRNHKVPKASTQAVCGMLCAVRCMLYAVCCGVPVVVMMQLTRYKNPLEGLALIDRLPLVPLVPLMPTTESILGTVLHFQGWSQLSLAFSSRCELHCITLSIGYPVHPDYPSRAQYLLCYCATSWQTAQQES